VLADTLTPMGIYLKLRDQYVNTLLLESSDYHGNENSYSYICCNPLASIQIDPKTVTKTYPDGSETTTRLEASTGLLPHLQHFVGSFSADPAVQFPFATGGLFGYMTYDSLEHLGGPKLVQEKVNKEEIPLLHYQLFGVVIVFNHFNNDLYLFCHTTLADQAAAAAQLASIEGHIYNGIPPAFGFAITGPEEASLTDDAFMQTLHKAVHHCQQGDTFQLVVSRRYAVPFSGDDFNVYRTLRSINPSPYLFYFDYGDYKIFGSSPEAQIHIQKGKATLYPIAGTFRRTGQDAQDAELARKLYDDPKENAEHVMLVDLARNDLSRSSDTVAVETFREIQYYSHVIHLVSKVTGKLAPGIDPLQLVADTFPAGTLSGAPKYRAMQLIDELEPDARSFYGGCIGFIDFAGTYNHAILIRSFLSQNNRLHYRAGAGVVAASDPASELQEVHNKLAALRQAMLQAEKMYATTSATPPTAPHLVVS
jgi:anthranilate synthase component 1